MPITYDPPQDGRFHAVASGRIDYEEVQRHLTQEDGDGLLSLPELIDARDASVALSGNEVRQIVAQLRRLGSRTPLGPTAVVVKSDFDYGMLRMLEMLVEDVGDVRPFRDPPEAEAWLETVAPRPVAG